MLVSSDVRFESFIPFWAIIFSTFFLHGITQLIDATHVEYRSTLLSCRTKPKHVAGTIDLVAA